MNSRSAIALAALTVVAAVVVTQFRSPTPDAAAPGTPNVILISIDTLRADQLTAYGSTQTKDPTLTDFSTQSIVFESHLNAAPTTLASHTSLFTGKYPHTHGVPRNDYMVPEANVMLPEWLGDAGFQSAAFIGSMPLAAHSGFDQGFDHFDESFTSARQSGDVDQTQRSAEEVIDAALGWVSTRDTDKPTFLFLHFFDVHAPYTPPEPYRSQALEGFTDMPADLGTMADVRAKRATLKRKGTVPAEEVEALQALYRGGIAYMDDQLARLFKSLDAQGLYDDSVIIITSDHGETFDRTGEFFDHGATVYHDTIHTPLMIRLPKAEHRGTRVPQAVSNIDVLPTLASLLHLQVPEGIEGIDLSESLSSGAAPNRGPVFSEATKPLFGRRANEGWLNKNLLKSAVEGPRKLIYSPPQERRELFDLSSDPVEAQPRRVPEKNPLFQAIQGYIEQTNPLDSPKASDKRVEAELKALGYLQDEEETDE